MKLTEKEAVKYVYFDAQNNNLRWSFSRSTNIKIGASAGGLDKKNGYWKVIINGTAFLSHRLIWILLNGSIPDNMYIDHVDRNRSNNSPDNLRLASRSENNKNIPIRKDNYSGKTGVYWHERSKRWVATINKNKKQIELGSFVNKEDAINTRKEIEKIEYGAFVPAGV